MKIMCTENASINRLELNHNGTNLKYMCFTRPSKMYETDVLNADRRATITFDDLSEVDAMIEMLTRFKEMCQESMGIWRRDNPYLAYL